MTYLRRSEAFQNTAGASDIGSAAPAGMWMSYDPAEGVAVLQDDAGNTAPVQVLGESRDIYLGTTPHDVEAELGNAPPETLVHIHATSQLAAITSTATSINLITDGTVTPNVTSPVSIPFGSVGWYSKDASGTLNIGYQIPVSPETSIHGFSTDLTSSDDRTHDLAGFDWQIESSGQTLLRIDPVGQTSSLVSAGGSLAANSNGLHLNIPTGKHLEINNDPGTIGQVPVSNGAGIPPSWQTVGGGSVSVVAQPLNNLASSDRLAIYSGTTNGIVTLPLANSVGEGTAITVRRDDIGDVAVTRSGADLIDNVTSPFVFTARSVPTGGSVTFFSDGNNNWYTTFTPIVKSYATLSNSTNQNYSVANVSQPIEFDTADDIFNLTHDPVGSPEIVTIIAEGVYVFTAQPQVSAGGGSAGIFHMWAQHDSGSGFVDIANSNVELTLTSNDDDVIPLSITIPAKAGDRIRFMSSVSNTGIFLKAAIPANEPIVPSAILSIYSIFK